MDELEEIKVTFFQECDELMADCEVGLLAMEAGTGDAETINAVFRAVHSVKGGAGAFGLEALVRYAHVFETLMEEVRSQRVVAEPELVRCLLRAADVLADQITAARIHGRPNEAATAAMVVELEGWITGHAGAAPADAPPASAGLDAPIEFAPVAFAPMALDPIAPASDDFGFQPMTIAIPDLPDLDFQPSQAVMDILADAPGPAVWLVTFKPHSDLYAKANEAALLLRELERLGSVETTLDESDLPDLENMEAESAYLGWTVRLTAEIEEAAIREVFEFVDGDCELTICRDGAAPESEAAADPIAALLAQAAAPMPVIDPIAPIPTPQPADAAAALMAELAAKPPSETPIPRLAAAAPASDEFGFTPTAAAPVASLPDAPVALAAPAPVEMAPAAAAAQAAVKGGAAPPAASQATIRVDPERIDKLIDLVGELVINQAMLAQRVAEHGFAPSSNIAMGLDELEQLTRSIQDGVMAIRAQSVKSVFQRMPRLVREVAAQTRKQARLVTDGEATEVDKTVIERLSDPITHMLRNAIDHGLETPAERIEAGKPAEGTVRLAALHRGGRIVIEVSDDGRGINRPRVRQIAIDKNLIQPDAVLTDEETDNLIFLPGFSTASVVSDISGRGVGMDVVRRSVQALGGRISIASRPGEGSTFTLSLPLTLAVLDGMVVDVAGHTLVVPLTAIIESLRPKADEVRALGPQGSVLAVRDSYVPLIDIGCVFGFRKVPIAPNEGVVLLIESEDGTRAALVADDIQGQRQVVIKSLESNYRQVEGIAAATILGDGRVALIADVDAMVAMRRRAAPADPVLYAAE
ncbi:MAG: CheA signal transduction histidine kinase [Caulobacter sp.]|nr:CheA signal transduction histidine kinase [Caulobacter sp.]